MLQEKVDSQEFAGRHTHQVRQEAAEFGTKVGTQRLIDFSHSADPASHNCTVTLWNWDENYMQD